MSECEITDSVSFLLLEFRFVLKMLLKFIHLGGTSTLILSPIMKPHNFVPHSIQLIKMLI